jgi:CHAD domain-containing protein
MTSQTIRRALTRRMRVLEQELPAALGHDAEAVHRARVATRRLREAMPVITPAPWAPHDRRTRRARALIRRLTSALGGVRELDVALAMLDEVVAVSPELALGAAAVRALVVPERERHRDEMRADLLKVTPEKLSRRLGPLVDGASPADAAMSLTRLRARLERRADRVQEAVAAAGALYAFDRLHVVRIAVKKLRYVLELVQELSRIRTLRLVNRLRQAQDLLGRLHDLEVLAAYVRRVSFEPDPGVVAQAAVILDRMERETRDLHAAYLKRTGVLAAVVAACRDDLAPRLPRDSAQGALPS